MEHITQKRLKELLCYDKGGLYWKVTNGPRGKAGSLAGVINSHGYRCITVDMKQYRSHRLIWLYHYGYLPKYIDHKYGKEIGDYLWNLRECTAAQNGANQRLGKSNTSGYKNVIWSKKSKRWLVRIKKNRKDHHIGSYVNILDAAKAAAEARIKLHGKFSNNG